MATVAIKPISADEFWDFVHLPENRERVFELERGEIVEMTKPGKFHGFVCVNISAILWNFARKRKKGYVCSNDTGVVVDNDPDTVRGPDILFFEDAKTAKEIDRKWARTPALLAIEVLSPTDSYAKIQQRVQEQLDFGTKLVWVVDPDNETVTVHRLGKKTYTVKSGQELTGHDVLPDFRCDVAEFFKMPGDDGQSEKDQNNE